MLLSRSSQIAIVTALLAGQTTALVLPDIAGALDALLHVASQAQEAAVEGVHAVAAAVEAIGDKLQIELLPSSAEAKFAPLVEPTGAREVIQDKYIVVFKLDVLPETIAFHQEWVGDVYAAQVAEVLGDEAHPQRLFLAEQTVDTKGGVLDAFSISGLAGYTGRFLPQTIDLIRRHPAVAFVEQDSVVHHTEFDIQTGLPWGLARVSHREPLSLGLFNKYLYDNDGGEGVTSYIIDTGVSVTHEDFEGRALWGKTIPEGDADEDGNGHGTHCAGTIGSAHYGVAKKANLVAVKVLRLNGSGTMLDVVKGVEYAANAHLAAVKANKKGFKGSTANMSLGGGKLPALDLAVNAAVKAGLHFAVAAGNENQDACNTSPAAAEGPVTVGALTISDARAYFSNWGKCVDVFAPGLNVLLTYIGLTTATATLLGTLMASPHVAGLLAYYVLLQPGLELEFFSAAGGVTPAQLKKNLVAYLSKGLLLDIPSDTPNLLVYNGAGHNISEFWGAEAAAAADEDLTVLLKHKLADLLAKAKTDSLELAAEIEEAVKEAYQ